MMRKIIMHIVLAVFMMTCANVNEPEYGTLLLRLDWSQIQLSKSKSRMHFSNLQAVQDWPSALHLLRITVMPGDQIFEFTESKDSYELSLELGIYTILIEGLDEQGQILFSSIQEKVLVKTNETTDIVLAMDANFPTAKTRFVDTPPEGRVDSSSFMLTWQHVEYATAYRLQESLKGDFSDSSTVYLGPDTAWICPDHDGGQYAFRVRAEHHIQNTDWSDPVQLWIDLTPNVAIVTDSLPPVMVGTPYHFDLTSSGGTPPYTWQVVGGQLPPGLSLTAGSVTGVPDQVGVFGFTVSARDAGDPGKHAEKQFYVSVLESPPPLQFMTKNLELARVNVAYEQPIVVSGGVPPYADWQVTSDAPFDITLIPSTGNQALLQCVPSQTGVFSVEISLSDHGTPPQQSSQKFNLTVQEALPSLTIITDVMPDGIENEPYILEVQAAGGVLPYTEWQVLSFAPFDFTMTSQSDSTALLSCVPTVDGLFEVTIQVSDSQDPAQVTEKTFEFNITPDLAPFVITTDSLPAALLNEPYRTKITARGGRLPYRNWSLSSDAPFDFSLVATSDSTADLQCIPSESGEFLVNLEVNDGSDPPLQALKSLTFNVSIPVDTLVIITESLSVGRVDTPFSQTVVATGGTPPYTRWQVESTAPFDLAIETLTDGSGLLTGMPTQAGLFEVTLTVSDNHDPVWKASLTFDLEILPALEPFVIITDTLPDARLNEFYTSRVKADGGLAPYHEWSMTSDAPFDIVLISSSDSTADLQCTPHTAGEFSISLQVKDSQDPQHIANKQLSLWVEAPPEPLLIVTDSLDHGRVNDAFEFIVVGSGGVAPYDWSLTHDAPFEMAITPQTGGEATITAMPTEADTFHVTVHLSDHASPQQSVEKTFVWTVDPQENAVHITTMSFPDAYTGQQYKEWVHAQGGTPPYSWSIVLSDDPDLRIIANDPERGVLLFTPTESGDIQFTLRVMDASTPVTMNERSYVLHVQEGTTQLLITTSALPKSRVNVDYSYQLSADGGVVPYTWELISPTYPVDEAEFELSTDGLLTGRPWEAKTIDIHIRVTDSASPPSSVEKHFNMVIQPAWLVIRDSDIPDGNVNESYYGYIAVDGGSLPFSWQITGLPPGLGVDVVNEWTRNIVGTPTAEGDYTLSVQVDDSGNPQQTVQQDYPIHIGPDPNQLAITTTSPLPDADFGTTYFKDIEATGATPSTRIWDLVSTDAPFDVYINDTNNDGTGELEFAPFTSGTFHITIKVSDASDATNTDQKTFEVTVPSPYDPLHITTTSPLPDAIYGTTYFQEIEATGGSNLVNRNWEIVSKTVPEPVTISNLNGNGLIEFEAFSVGTYTITVKVSDTGDSALWDQKQFTVTVPSP